MMVSWDSGTSGLVGHTTEHLHGVTVSLNQSPREGGHLVCDAPVLAVQPHP